MAFGQADEKSIAPDLKKIGDMVLIFSAVHLSNLVLIMARKGREPSREEQMVRWWRHPNLC